jgi:Tfp pilus tip-associated adhesin PilY1
MDVTDPTNPVLLWEKAADPSVRVGTTISAPAMGQALIGGEMKWVAVLGSGYDVDYVDNYENKNAWLTVIQLNNGTILKQIKVSTKVGNVLTDITPLRYPANGVLRKIYFGDYYGVLWRINGEDLDSLADGATLTEASHMLFKPDNYATYNYPQDVKRPITVRPTVGQGETITEFWVYFGTGDFNEYEGAPPYPNQAFYGLKDQADPYVGDASPLVNLTDSTTTNAAHESWFIKLGISDSSEYILNTTTGDHTIKGSNERVLRPAEVYGGFTFFTTYEPENSTCGGGISRFYAVQYNAGTLESGLFKNIKNGGNTILAVRGVELPTTGIPSKPLILESSGGATPVAAGTVSSTSGELIKVELDE